MKPGPSYLTYIPTSISHTKKLTNHQAKELTNACYLTNLSPRPKAMGRCHWSDKARMLAKMTLLPCILPASS